MMADMHDQSQFYQAAVNSVLDPSPANIRAMLDLAIAESIGIPEASTVRKGLLSLLENPDDELLDQSQADVEAARVRVHEAREAADRARLALDEAESEHVNQQSANRVLHSRRLSADRATKNPNVKRAWGLMNDDKEAK